MNENLEWYLQELIRSLDLLDGEQFSSNEISINIGNNLIKDIKYLSKGLQDKEYLKLVIDYDEIFLGKEFLDTYTKQQLKNDNYNMIKNFLADNFIAYCQTAWLQCELIITILIEFYGTRKGKILDQIVDSFLENTEIIIQLDRRNNLNDYLKEKKINKLWMNNRVTVFLLIMYHNPEYKGYNEDYKKLKLFLESLYKLRCIAAHRERVILTKVRIEQIFDEDIKNKALELYNNKLFFCIKDKIYFIAKRTSYWLAG